MSHFVVYVIGDDVEDQLAPYVEEGAVSNEKDQREWDIEFLKFMESVDKEETLTVVDCHI